MLQVNSSSRLQPSAVGVSLPIQTGLVERPTDNASQGEEPTFLEAASCLRRLYSDRICFGAGRVFGRANGEPIRAFSDDDSLDMVVSPGFLAAQSQCRSRIYIQIFGRFWKSGTN